MSKMKVKKIRAEIWRDIYYTMTCINDGRTLNFEARRTLHENAIKLADEAVKEFDKAVME